jgi:hypothetical protein
LNYFYRCTVINITGFSSPHKDDVIDTNDRCDPTMTSYVEFSDCGGAIIDEQPAKLAEAIRLFLQGLGYSKKDSFFETIKSVFSVSFKHSTIFYSQSFSRTNS